jgi:Rrf2 family protein
MPDNGLLWAQNNRMFSKACEYGIRAAILVASESMKGNRLGLAAIAHKIDSPQAFTAKILQKLVKKKIILSIKGPGGGFTADTKNLDKINLAEIIVAIDGAILNQCSLGLTDCSERRPCPFHHKYKPLKEKLLTLYNETSLKDLSKGIDSGQAYLKLR